MRDVDCESVECGLRGRLRGHMGLGLIARRVAILRDERLQAAELSAQLTPNGVITLATKSRGHCQGCRHTDATRTSL